MTAESSSFALSPVTPEELRRRLESGETVLTGLDLRGLDLRGFDFSHAVLKDCDLSGAQLEGVNFQYANLEGADLENTTANNTQFYGCRYDHSTRWPKTLNYRSLQAFGPYSSLICAHLAGVPLPGVDLRRADLSSANMERCILDEADLRETLVRRANLFEASLREADLRGADLSKARLRRACLDGADLRGVDLRDADLREISSEGARFEDAQSNFRTRWPEGFDQGRTMGRKVGRLPVWIVYIPIFWPLIFYLLLGRGAYQILWRINRLSGHLARESTWPLLDDFAFSSFGFHNDKRFALSWPVSWPLIMLCSLFLLVYASIWGTWNALCKSLRGGFKFTNEVVDLLWTWTKS